MKVILNQTVPKVGKQGQIVSVADGFARNFLFPRGLAILAEKNQLVALERRNAKAQAKGAETLASAQSLKERLDGQTVKIEGKVGRDAGKLFGAITAQDVADALKSQLGIELERKRIALVQPIKRLGDFPVEIDLHQEVDAKITVTVFDPEAPVVEEKAPEPEETEEEPVAVEA